MKTLLATLLVSSLAFADPPDAPKAAPLVPMTHDEAVAALTCAKDLADCAAAGKVDQKWVVIGVGAGVVAGVVIGIGVGAVMAKR